MSTFKTIPGNTDIQGNANISRNANVGGHAYVGGDVAVGHNLIVKGWVDAPNIKGACKGLYASEEALKAAYPRPMPGWFALVGNTLPAQVWRAERAGNFGLTSSTQCKWTPTGETGGEFNLWLDQLQTDVKDLTDDVRDLEELLDNGLLLGETIAFTSTGTAAAMTFTVMKRDGSTKEHSKPIPIVTTEKAGMMSAADKVELSAATAAIAAINEKISTLETATTTLREALNAEIRNREQADDALQALIDRLREDFDALVGENASEKIDNFKEVLAFLDGLNDSEKLSARLAELSGRLDAEERKSSPTVACEEILELHELPGRAGTYLQRDEEGDIVQIAVSDGKSLRREPPEEGKVYVCGGRAWLFNGITVEPAGLRHFIFDGGNAGTTYPEGSHEIGGGGPETDYTVARVYDGQGARPKRP